VLYKPPRNGRCQNSKRASTEASAPTQGRSLDGPVARMAYGQIGTQLNEELRLEYEVQRRLDCWRNCHNCRRPLFCCASGCAERIDVFGLRMTFLSPPML
jgi:hypothetical protein